MPSTRSYSVRSARKSTRLAPTKDHFNRVSASGWDVYGLFDIPWGRNIASDPSCARVPGMGVTAAGAHILFYCSLFGVHCSEQRAHTRALPRTCSHNSDRATVSLNEATSATPHMDVTASTAADRKIDSAPPRLTRGCPETAWTHCIRLWVRS